jgi:hypothetical protein
VRGLFSVERRQSHGIDEETMWNALVHDHMPPADVGDRNRSRLLSRLTLAADRGRS